MRGSYCGCGLQRAEGQIVDVACSVDERVRLWMWLAAWMRGSYCGCGLQRAEGQIVDVACSVDERVRLWMWLAAC